VVVPGAAAPPSTATAAGCPFGPSTTTSVVPDPTAVAAYYYANSFYCSISIFFIYSGVKIGSLTYNTCTRFTAPLLARLLIPTRVTSGFKMGDIQANGPSLAKSIIS